MDDGGARRTADAPDQGRLETLASGMPVIFGGDRVARVSPELAAAFQAGDRLIVVQETGALLRVPAAQQALAQAAVSRALQAFHALAAVTDEAVSAFFEGFAARLEADGPWAEIAAANADDVARARARGRSTTRLEATAAMRADMAAGLRAWGRAEAGRNRVIERVEHDGWSVEQAAAPLGVVGFVFEGRPNVFADAAGVIRSGNTVVFRIGSDALGTAQAIVRAALAPALAEAGLPEGCAVLLESAEHAAGWAMFSDPRLALAVARGSGSAVAQLGAIARQAGVPVSLHGTGGAWLVAAADADPERLYAAVFHSLDRKVCNTLNVCCVARTAAPALVPVILAAVQRAGERRKGAKLHAVGDALDALPAAWREARILVARAEGLVEEPRVEPLDEADLGREWEWEETPELTLLLVDDAAQAAALFNRYSPRFAASLVSADPAAHERFYAAVDAPFVGDGFTRWVDGQYALNRPELGLSNWANGRLFARGGVLSGDGVFTVRARVRQADPHLDRAGAPTPPRPTGS
jgi:glutamate-5-semialdehyde dehydrogenase